MGILKKLFKSPKNGQGNSDKIELGVDKNENPVIWDTVHENNCFFVGNSSDRYNVLLNIKSFIRKEAHAWQFMEIFTPSHQDLRMNTEDTPDKIKFLLQDITSMFKEIQKRWESDNESLQSVSVMLVINQASLFSMTQEEWESEYPLVPYKASLLLQTRLSELMVKAKDYPLHIILLDDKFENYGHLVENYFMNFGIEADENSYLHKVEI